MDRLPNETLDNAISVYKKTIKVVEENKDSDYCTALDKVTVALLEELKEYRDAEEQGMLLKLPCKVEDTVYALSFSNDEGKIFEAEVKVIKIDSQNLYAVAHCEELGLGVTLFFDRFGKTVFLTKAEAEAKLAEMRGGSDEEM